MRYARAYSRRNRDGHARRRGGGRNRYGSPAATTRGSAPPLLAYEWPSESDETVEFRDAPNRIEISVHLPDVDRDDVDVTLSESALRIRARPAGGADDDREGRPDGVDRTIALNGTAVTERADVSWADSTLTVTFPKAVRA